MGWVGVLISLVTNRTKGGTLNKKAHLGTAMKTNPFEGASSAKAVLLGPAHQEQQENDSFFAPVIFGLPSDPKDHAMVAFIPRVHLSPFILRVPLSG